MEVLVETINSNDFGYISPGLLKNHTFSVVGPYPPSKKFDLFVSCTYFSIKHPIPNAIFTLEKDAKLEKRRNWAKKELAKYMGKSIIAKSVKVKEIKDLKEFLDKNPEYCVLKGLYGSTVCSSPEEVLIKKKNYVSLERFVKGTEIAFGRWWDGSKFVGPVLVNFEHKPKFDNNIEPQTGEMGTVAFYTYKVGKIIERFFEATSNILKKTSGKSVTYVDGNFILESSGQLKFLEYTVRFGEPTIFMQHVMHPDLIQFFHNLANKRVKDSDFIQDKWAIVATGHALVDDHIFRNRLPPQFSDRYTLMSGEVEVSYVNSTLASLIMVPFIGDSLKSCMKKYVSSFSKHGGMIYFRTDIGKRVIKAVKDGLIPKDVVKEFPPLE